MRGFSYKRFLAVLIVALGLCLWAVTGMTHAQTAVEKPVMKEAAPASKSESSLSEEEKQNIVNELRRELLEVLDNSQKDAKDRNELRSKILEYRADNIGWWLAFIAIVFTVLGVVFAAIGLVGGYIGFNIFQNLKTDAKESVKEVNQIVDDARNRAKEADEIAANARISAEKAKELVEEIEKEHSRAKSLTSNMETMRDVMGPEVSTQDENLAEKIEKARTLENQNIEEAINKWREIAQAPEVMDEKLTARAWFAVGFLLDEQRKFEEAIAAYSEGLRLRPKYAPAYNNRGISKDHLGRHESAISDFDEAIRLQPNLAEVYNNRGVAKQNLKQYEAAIADYGVALRLKPDYPAAYNNRGNSNRFLRQYEAAIADYEEALRLRPVYAEAYNNRGAAKFDLGQYEAAIEDYEEACRLKSDYAAAYYNLGEAKVKLCRKEEARADLTTALNLAREGGNVALVVLVQQELSKLYEQ